METSDRELRRIGRFVGMTELIGVLGLLAAVGLLVEGDTAAAGGCLVAAALAYGLGLNALVRR